MNMRPPLRTVALLAALLLEATDAVAVDSTIYKLKYTDQCPTAEVAQQVVFASEIFCCMLCHSIGCTGVCHNNHLGECRTYNSSMNVYFEEAIGFQTYWNVDKEIVYRSYEVMTGGGATWDAGTAFCTSKGARLALPKTPEENAELMAKAAALGGASYFWIDSNDRAVEDTFVNAATGVELSYIEWRDGQPNGLTEQNCMAVRNSNGLFEDKPCDDLYIVICEQ